MVASFFRWLKNNGTGIKYQNLIPTFSRSGEDDDADDAEAEESKPKRPKKSKVLEDDAVMYKEYDWDFHQFVAHLRRVHPDNPPTTVDLDGSKIVVKAADPFAPPGVPLYYFHGRPNFYNDVFFDCWDNFFAPTFNIVCPWFTVDSLESLDLLFDLELEE